METGFGQNNDLGALDPQETSTVNPSYGNSNSNSIWEAMDLIGDELSDKGSMHGEFQHNLTLEFHSEYMTDSASIEALDLQKNEKMSARRSPLIGEEITFCQTGSISNEAVIELLDSDDEAGNKSDETDQLGSPNFKRKYPTEGQAFAKRPLSGGEASYLARRQNMPGWMRRSEPVAMANHLNKPQAQEAPQGIYGAAMEIQQYFFTEPQYIPQNFGYIPTWKALQSFEEATKVGTLQQQAAMKYYELSLLNVSEFTVNGGTSNLGYETTSLSGLRVHIKSIARDHGKAIFERDTETQEGKWRIPLGAYRSFYSFLAAQPNTTVNGIDETQLKIASLGKARLEKDYPSEKKLVDLGVPPNIANTLAPFQRGGVEFVYEKGGRALIADEMGLGKTIQGIASMSLYHEEWPVLVLCPSGARYHWQIEFVNWLGEQKQDVLKLPTGPPDEEAEIGDDSMGCRSSPPSPPSDKTPCMEHLTQRQVHVLTSGKETVLPDKDTKVVICSYGLAPAMIKNKRIFPGLFQCAIVDESHMLKNKKSKRTQHLLPVLQATRRCVLLSGTPAFARPMELWPQLMILGTAKNGWDIKENEFIQKYAKGGSKQRRAELHTMLTGTIMIRRMKNDILKSLPAKVREQAIVEVINESQRKEFQQCIASLREGKGALGKIAQGVTNSDRANEAPLEVDSDATYSNPAYPHDSLEDQATFEMQHMYQQGKMRIQEELAGLISHLDPVDMQKYMSEQDQNLQQRCRAFYAERLDLLRSRNSAVSLGKPQAEIPSRKSVLMHMFKMTGKVKVPIIVEMLKKRIDDPGKGKLCIFAHHIFVLNEIERLAGLSNAEGCSTKFIRIDGSTGPKFRQEQINKFQKDPTVRIALLGITAAGVAVTLTASSHVWFAELFWTPALMIQAEDRCHRIGQQARVRCLYIVAKGTLDEILWKHVEKKFRNLGEFVEGKEKMKMVVHKTYKGAEEWRMSLERTTEEEDGEDFDDGAEPKFIIDDDGVEEEIVNEIHQLEEEEQAMLRASESDDDDLEGESKELENLQSIPKGQKVGSSEADAICLSDDEDEAGKSFDNYREADNRRQSPPQPFVKDWLLSKSFPGLRLYKMHFSGETYGLDIVAYSGRIVVRGQSEKRIEQLGLYTKPAPGDIVVACNNKYIPYGWELNNALLFLARTIKLSRSPVELMFAEDTEFSDFFAANPPIRDDTPPPVPSISAIDFDSVLKDAQDFDRHFDGPNLGLNIQLVDGFLVVVNLSHSLANVGLREGDIVLAVNGQFLPRGTSLEDATAQITYKLRVPPVSISFRRSEKFSHYFALKNDQIRKQNTTFQNSPAIIHALQQLEVHRQDSIDAIGGAGVIDLVD